MENQLMYAWAAGFIDGEGTITIKRYKRFGKIVYQVYMSVAQANHANHFDAVYKLQKMFGGSISKYKSKGIRQAVISWAVVSRGAIECVKKIRPYLQVKHKNADILLSYYEGVGQRPKNYRLSEDELKKREEKWLEIRLLNQKGKLQLQRLNELALKRDVIV